MALSIELTIHERLKMCGHRCENEHKESFRAQSIRCPNEHGKMAETYKGKVILLPHYLTKMVGDVKLIRMWCHKCSMDYAKEQQSKRNTHKRPKQIDKDQTDLFK